MTLKRFPQILSVAAAALLALALIGASASAKSSDGTRSFHGNVSSIAKNKSSIVVNTTSGSRVRFVIRASTTYEHVSGISGLSKGTPVEVEAFRSGDRWIAARIEANPGGSGGHGSDDGPGDDHGSGGHGSDD
jgi:hypothetical protein